MFSWFQRSKQKKLDISHLLVDIHSHFIPGIDDGAESMEESVRLITKMQELGYQKIYTTPHVIWDCYRNTPEIILSGLHEVRKACKENGLTIEINAAAEYFIDEHFVKLLDDEDELLLLPGRRLLVELPYTTPLKNTFETLFSIIERGYQPVLAHPERYNYYHNDFSAYKKLSDQGCELQLNILSVSGQYGESIRKIAEELLKNKLITFLGTDAHRIQHLNAIESCDRKSLLSNYVFQNEKLLFSAIHS